MGEIFVACFTTVLVHQLVSQGMESYMDTLENPDLSMLIALNIPNVPLSSSLSLMNTKSLINEYHNAYFFTFEHIFHKCINV